MSLIESLKKFWAFLKKDTWPSWIVSIILVIIIIKFIFFPLLSLATGTTLPLVVVESCSMYHESNFDAWWSQNAAWYGAHGITKADFQAYPFTNGLNKGDIIIVWGRTSYSKGNIIIFNSRTQYPIIHRLISLSPLETKGDHNSDQLPGGLETNINPNQVLGRAIFKIPALGWIKLIFYEPFRSPAERGLCK